MERFLNLGITRCTSLQFVLGSGRNLPTESLSPSNKENKEGEPLLDGGEKTILEPDKVIERDGKAPRKTRSTNSDSAPCKQDIAVEISGLRYQEGSLLLLDDFNLSVPRGKM